MGRIELEVFETMAFTAKRALSRGDGGFAPRFLGSWVLFQEARLRVRQSLEIESVLGLLVVSMC